MTSRFHTGITERVLEALRSGVKGTIADVVAATGLTHQQVSDGLKNLARTKGVLKPCLVRRKSYGLYELLTAPVVLAPVPKLKAAPAAKARAIKPAPVAPPKPAIVAAPTPAQSKRFVVGQTFREFEVIAGDEIFKTLLRGGDVRMLLRSEGARSLIRKFQSMRASAASQQSAPARAAHASSPGAANYALDGADLSTQAGG